MLGLVASGLASAACGGSTSSSPSPDLTASANAFCDQLSALACVPQEAVDSCRQQVSDFVNEAKSAGCTAQAQQYLDCLNGVTYTCDGSGQPDTSRCSSQRSAVNSCKSSSTDQCSGAVFGNGGGGDAGPTASCSVTCSDFSADCTGTSPNGPVSCACTGGAHDGATFQTAGCSALESTAKQTCR